MFYEPLNVLNRMCELWTFFQIWSYMMAENMFYCFVEIELVSKSKEGPSRVTVHTIQLPPQTPFSTKETCHTMKIDSNGSSTVIVPLIVSVCVCVCVCVCLVCLSVCLCLSVRVFVSVCLCLCLSVCAYVCLYVYTTACVCVCVCMYICVKVTTKHN